MKNYQFMRILSLVAYAVPLVLAISSSSSSSSSRYLAPLLERTNKVEDEYMVVFKQGHRLEDHEKAVGRSLSDLIRTEWSDDDDPVPGYAAALDAETLALVRSDPMVDFVEQDYHFTIMPFEEAEPARPNDWVIRLERGHTLADHFKVIGKDYSDSIIRDRGYKDPETRGSEEPDGIVYVAYLTDQADLDLIRSDPNVYSVITDTSFFAVSNPIREEVSVQKHDEL